MMIQDRACGAAWIKPEPERRLNMATKSKLKGWRKMPKAMLQAVAQSDLFCATARVWALACLRQMVPGGDVVLPIDSVVEHTGISRRSAQQALSRLTEAGFLELTGKGYTGAGMYRPTTPTVQDSAQGAQESAPQEPQGVQDSAREGVQDSAHRRRTETKKNSNDLTNKDDGHLSVDFSADSSADSGVGHAADSRSTSCGEVSVARNAAPCSSPARPQGTLAKVQAFDKSRTKTAKQRVGIQKAKLLEEWCRVRREAGIEVIQTPTKADRGQMANIIKEATTHGYDDADIVTGMVHFLSNPHYLTHPSQCTLSTFYRGLIGQISEAKQLAATMPLADALQQAWVKHFKTVFDLAPSIPKLNLRQDGLLALHRHYTADPDTVAEHVVKWFLRDTDAAHYEAGEMLLKLRTLDEFFAAEHRKVMATIEAERRMAEERQLFRRAREIGEQHECSQQAVELMQAYLSKAISLAELRTQVAELGMTAQAQ